jgi:hypothetical protein
MTTTNVSQGITTHNINTTDMSPARYNIEAEYTDANIYNNAEASSILTVNDPNKVIIDCNSIESFTCISDNFSTTTPQLNNDGYITNIYNYYTICTQPITRNTTITGIIRTNYNSQMGWGLTKQISGLYPRFWQFSPTLQESHNSSNNEYATTLNRITQNTDYHFTYAVDNEGYITYTDDNNQTPIKSSKTFTDTEISSLHMKFRHWNSTGRIILKQLTYQYNTNGGQ